MRDRARAPLFVIGVDRSGTTLLSMMLDSHSRIAIPYESHFITKYYMEREQYGDLKNSIERRKQFVKSILSEYDVQEWDHQINLEDIDINACNTLEDTVSQIFSAYARYFGKDIWAVKSPRYTLYLHMLNRMFPTARFIHIIRDGRDVANSLVLQRWGPNNFVSALRYWAETVKCARKMLRMLPDDRFVELRFEELVNRPDKELEKICSFVGVAFEPAMLENYTSRAAAKVGFLIKDRHSHLKEGPTRSQAFKWKKSLSAADQALAYEIAGDVLEELGYEPGVKTSRRKLFRKIHHRVKEMVEYRLKGRWKRSRAATSSRK